MSELKTKLYGLSIKLQREIEKFETQTGSRVESIAVRRTTKDNRGFRRLAGVGIEVSIDVRRGDANWHDSDEFYLENGQHTIRKRIST